MRVKPFMAATLLVFSEWARLGYDCTGNSGVDLYLNKKAKAEEEEARLELEGVDTQIALMDSLTDDGERSPFSAARSEALDIAGLTGEQVKGMVAAWQEGDPDALLAVARQYDEKIPGASAFEERFIWSRHDAMMTKIQDWLDHGKVSATSSRWAPSTSPAPAGSSPSCARAATW